MSNPSLDNEEISIDSGYVTDDELSSPASPPSSDDKNEEDEAALFPPSPSISAQNAYKPKCKPAVLKENDKNK
jgi:hypothetical protein